MPTFPSAPGTTDMRPADRERIWADVRRAKFLMHRIQQTCDKYYPQDPGPRIHVDIEAAVAFTSANAVTRILDQISGEEPDVPL